ncbi:MAG: 3-phosphoserine/phosphohydroxythreonine transaminase [Actinomycetota bacterium]|nr:3-phosphoserine/phosphohydroxythreonine transaminase [Actinomycetota bacterium]
MSDRAFNFAAGPGILPLPVLEQARQDLVSLPGVGASPLEVSHRGPWFTSVIEEAGSNLRDLLAIPDGYQVVFCQGGASMQFSMVPMNLLRGTRATAEYVITGSWGSKAIAEAQKEGTTRIAWTGKDEGFVRVPGAEELLESIGSAPAYVHVTSNETIQGVEFPTAPIVPDGVPLVADVSSDFLSRPIDIGRYGLLYAGAQKNAGPAGVTVVIVRDDLLDRIPDGLPSILDYRTYVKHGSRYNTPPVFAIYIVMLITRWLRDEVGGLDEMHARNRDEASLLYDILDAAPTFFRGHAQADSRSLMNVTFRLPSEDLEARFLAEAAERGLVELKGHRSVGGVRASIYNAMPREGVEALAAFMHEFRERAGDAATKERTTT